MQDYRNRRCKHVPNQRTCVYCGRPSTCLDHFVPLDHVYSMSSIGEYPNRITVESCYECNAIASDSVFNTLADKRKFIQRELRERYGKLLHTPKWTEQELNHLGPGLSRYIRCGQLVKEVIQQRILWKGTDNPNARELERIRK